MTMVVTHAFTSAKPDDGDTSLVRPSNWNANHTLTGTVSTAQLDASIVAIINQAQVLASIQFGAL